MEAGNTTKGVSLPAIHRVGSDVFNRFQTKRKKYGKWKKFLDLNDEKQKKIYSDLCKGKRVILQDEKFGCYQVISNKHVWSKL